jgi:hypothetical protein
MRFFLFILTNALLFLRPSEFVPELHALELYRYAILACLVISFPVVLEQLQRRYPGVPPVAGCVLGLLPAVLCSNLLTGDLDRLRGTTEEFFKVVLYYLLLLALVDSTARLKQFLHWITLFIAGLALVAILRYHADIAVPAAPPPDAAQARKGARHTFVVDMVRDAQTGAMVPVQRLCGTGIFNDPNDLALMLVCGIILCLFWIGDPTRQAGKPFWLGLMALFGYGLMLTHSRGGFLALLASVGLFLHTRYGGKKTLLLGFAVLPALFVVFAGRMTSISTSEGTGQSRIQLWSDCLVLFQQSPLVGIGASSILQYSSHVAHNSFIHGYTELGLFGGTLFLGAYYYAIRGVALLRPDPAGGAADEPVDPELRRLRPYLLGMTVAYAVGLLFLSRCYLVPTYFILGLATAYLRLHTGQRAEPVTAWSRMVVPRLAGVSLCFLFASYTFVRLLNVR